MLTWIKGRYWITIVIGHVTKSSFNPFPMINRPQTPRPEWTVTLEPKIWHPSKFYYEITHVHLNTDLNNCCIFISSVP